ncbi:MAG: FAD/NAD(P)-binding oxidoreductase [Bacteroidota bacterium]
MSISSKEDARCIIIGASHGGINAAFAVRQFGWKGHIDVYDALTSFPHQKPPLSKAFLLGNLPESMLRLRAEKAFEKAKINLHLGSRVENIDKDNKTISVSGNTVTYDQLIISTGADAFIPRFKGIDQATNIFTIRHLPDAEALKKVVDTFIEQEISPKVVIIGAGYIGLEAAASLTKFGADVTVLERESRVLQRVTAPVMSTYFTDLHTENGVNIVTAVTVSGIDQKEGTQYITCENGTAYQSDIIIVGVGVKVNQSLAKEAGLKVENGVCVDEYCRTSDENIYAIGDCAQHHSFIYNRKLRLESVQNAMDQANIAAMNICGKTMKYDKVPWFWSDQYGLKLQIVGLLNDYTDTVVRRDESDPKSISVWYFKEDTLISVDAVNQPKAYMLGMRLIPKKAKVDKTALINAQEPIRPADILLEES